MKVEQNPVNRGERRKDTSFLVLSQQIPVIIEQFSTIVSHHICEKSCKPCKA